MRRPPFHSFAPFFTNFSLLFAVFHSFFYSSSHFLLLHFFSNDCFSFIFTVFKVFTVFQSLSQFSPLFTIVHYFSKKNSNCFFKRVKYFVFKQFHSFHRVIFFFNNNVFLLFFLVFLLLLFKPFSTVFHCFHGLVLY